jgi:hypothetical protein
VKSSQGKETKVEAFEHLELFQVREESAKAQEEHNCRRIQPKRSRPLKISCPGSSGRARRAEEILSSWISLRIGDSRQICREELEV